MKAYFKKMFDYDRFSSHKILDLMASSCTVGRPVELMGHMMGAQQTWLKRCKNLPAPGGPIWPDYPLSELSAIIDRNHAEWIEFLESVDEFDQVIVYKNSQGAQFRTALTDIITQVTNHGTHHRGQIGAMLKTEGHEIPGLDFILFVRSLGRQI